MFKALFKKLIQLLTNTKDEITVKQNLSQGKNNTQIGVQVNHIYVISESDQSHIADKVKEVLNQQNSIAGYTWISEDKKISFLINESGYCQQSGFFVMEPRTLVSITFPHPFDNCEYGFFIEPFNISIEHIKKTTAGVSFIIGHKCPPELLLQNIRWIAVGVCG